VRERLGVVAESVLDELISAIDARSAERALALVHRLIADGHNLQHFCREAIRHVRNLLVARVCGADSDLVAAPPDERARLAEQAARFGEEDLTRFFQILLLTDDDLRRKPDPRLHLELGILKLVNAGRLAPLEEVLASLRHEVRDEVRDEVREEVREKVRRESAAPVRPFSAGPAQRPETISTGGGAAAATAPARSPSFSSAPQTEFAPARLGGPAAALPPRVVAGAVEATASGIAAAQVAAIKEALQNQKFLSSMVADVSRWELEGGEMRLFFPSERRVLAEMLQGSDAMERLRTVLTQVVGQPLRVCVKLDSARTGIALGSDLRARYEQDPIVRAMLERFGGRISEVKRRSED